MKPRHSLDRMLAVLTLSFGSLCIAAFLASSLDGPDVPEVPEAAHQVDTPLEATPSLA